MTVTPMNEWECNRCGEIKISPPPISTSVNRGLEAKPPSGWVRVTYGNGAARHLCKACDESYLEWWNDVTCKGPG